MASTISAFLSLDELLPSNVSRLIRGTHGIGKSEIIGQIAERRKMPMIDRRLSQMTEGDIDGLPVLEGPVTKFKPVDWFVAACNEPHVLFLDELNRATPEVMQSAFQIVLDHELNGYKLHPETIVYAAVNSGSRYSVNDIDPALLDRFAVIDLEPSVQELAEYFRSKKYEESFVTFLLRNPNHVDPPGQYKAGQVTPSRRSWERFYKGLKAGKIYNQPSSELFLTLGSSLVGDTATNAFANHLKQEKPITVEEILSDYGKPDSDIRARVKKLTDDRWLDIIDSFGSYVATNKLNAVPGPHWPYKDCETEEEAFKAEGLPIYPDDGAIESPYEMIKRGKMEATPVVNFSLWFRDAPASLRVHIWKTMVASVASTDKEDKKAMIVSIHWGIKEAMCMAFGVRSGPRGANMRPKLIEMHGVTLPEESQLK